MGLEHSFTNYVKEKFYNELFEALQDFITNHIDNLELRLNLVEEIDEAELSDIDIKQIYIADSPGTITSFDILLEAYIEVSDENKRLVDERETGYQWFILECSSDMENSFRDLLIQHIDIYNQRKDRSKVKGELSEYFVPIINKEQLEYVAIDFLKQYYPESLVTPTPIDPELLAGKMNLMVYKKRITKENTIFGQIYFKDTVATLVYRPVDGSLM